MRHALLLLLSLVSLAANAVDPLIWGEQERQFDYDFDANTKPWQEIQSLMPAYPKPEHFIAIPLGARSSNQFFIDYPSVTAGEDGVVRYSMVIRSPSGAETISFEGMRCTTGERKLYAFGHGDGKGGGQWSRNRNARWEPIQGRSLNDFRRELFYHYFCTVDAPAKLPAIQRNLKTGGKYTSE
jgi:hypothetical protein